MNDELATKILDELLSRTNQQPRPSIPSKEVMKMLRTPQIYNLPNQVPQGIPANLDQLVEEMKAKGKIKNYGIRYKNK